ncbi:MAG: hypothetical protein ACHBN1_32660 [Heteroscytonema crispum UTEX LB 1556]
MPIDSHHQNLTTVIDPQTLEYLKRIWALLQNSPGFDPTQLTRVLAQILMKPQTYQTGQYIVSNLLQRTIDRLINHFFLPKDHF